MIKKGHFHGYWHFERDTESLLLPPLPPLQPGPTIFPPEKIITRGRPQRDRSTRRDPSLFEITAGSTALRRQRPGQIRGERSAAHSTPQGPLNGLNGAQNGLGEALNEPLQATLIQTQQAAQNEPPKKRGRPKGLKDKQRRQKRIKETAGEA